MPQISKFCCLFDKQSTIACISNVVFAVTTSLNVLNFVHFVSEIMVSVGCI